VNLSRRETGYENSTLHTASVTTCQLLDSYQVQIPLVLSSTYWYQQRTGRIRPVSVSSDTDSRPSGDAGGLFSGRAVFGIGWKIKSPQIARGSETVMPERLMADSPDSVSRYPRTVYGNTVSRYWQTTYGTSTTRTPGRISRYAKTTYGRKPTNKRKDVSRLPQTIYTNDFTVFRKSLLANGLSESRTTGSRCRKSLPHNDLWNIGSQGRFSVSRYARTVYGNGLQMPQIVTPERLMAVFSPDSTSRYGQTIYAI